MHAYREEDTDRHAYRHQALYVDIYTGRHGDVQMPRHMRAIQECIQKRAYTEREESIHPADKYRPSKPPPRGRES